MANKIELKVLSAGAVKGGVSQLAAEFERTAGTRVTIDYAPANELRDRVAAGETADVLIMPQAMLDELSKQGKIALDSRALLGRSRMGVAVHADAPPHGMADTAAFKQLVLGASAVVHNKASSGMYAAKLLDQLGLAKALGAKIIIVSSGAAVMEYVAAYPPAAVGLAQISEIMVLIARGCPVRLAAPLPDEIQNATTYFAAAIAQGAARQAASALVQLLTAPAAKPVFAATGID